MIEVFKQEGIPLRPQGNTPIDLSGAENVWLVRSGLVHIFGIQSKEGRIAGPRVHLFCAEPGQLLFSTGANSGENIGFLAVGAQKPEILELGMSRFEDLISSADALTSPIETAIEGWIRGLSLGVRKGMLPKFFEEFEAGIEVVVPEGKNLRPAADLLWVVQLDGRSRFMGKNGLPEIGQGIPFPLSNQAWLASLENTKLLSMDTQTCIRGSSIRPGLDLFHSQVRRCIEINRQEYESEERERLKTKAGNERSAFKISLRRLSSILEPDKALRIVGDEKDALLAACRMVGEKQGFEFKSPPVEAMAIGDPLDAIFNLSRARKRQVILKGKWWEHDNGPLLGFMEEDRRPIAIMPAKEGYEIYDPSTEARKKIVPENASNLSPVAYMFYHPLPDRVLKGWDLCREGLRGCGKDLISVALLAMAGSVLGLVTPIATGVIFDTFIPDASRLQLFQIAFILFACTLATACFELTNGIALLRIESKMDASLQAGIMDRVLCLPVPFFRNFSSGDLADRALGINEIRRVMSSVAVHAILAGIFSTFDFALMFWYDKYLALVATALALGGMIFISAASLVQVRYQRVLIHIQGELFGTVLQFVTGISKIRLSGSEDRAFSAWAAQFGRQRAFDFKAGTASNILKTFNAAFPVFSMMAIFAWVSSSGSAAMSAGNFLAFIAVYGSFQAALLQVSATLVSTLQVVPLYERAKPILETLPEVDAKRNYPGELAGDIEISHVNFRYSPDGHLVLDDISFRAKPGEFVALVGASGSGKSTMFRLLLGFEFPESGTIYYDGQDLSGLDVRAVRRQIGVVLQNGRIMAGSIFENIVGASNLTIDDAWEAARMAGLENDIQQMPMGMHTVLSPGGGTLSGGQRQRLMIARAIVRKPRVILFDEATSALDNLTQSIVSRSLEKLQATRVVIAHRLSTIIKADRIFVFDRGRLVQSGNYKLLIEQEGPFAELAKRQLM